MSALKNNFSRTEPYGNRLSSRKRRILYLQRELAKLCRPGEVFVGYRSISRSVHLREISAELDRTCCCAGYRQVFKRRYKCNVRADRTLIEFFLEVKGQVVVGKVYSGIDRLRSTL